MTAELHVSDCLCSHLRKSTRLLTQHYDAILRPAGIRITQFNLMAAVAEMRESAFVPLAAVLGMDRTTLARNVQLMARDGLVEVREGKNDRRQQVVRLTPQGTLALAKAMPLWRQAQTSAIERIGRDAAQPLLQKLEQLASDDRVATSAEE